MRPRGRMLHLHTQNHEPRRRRGESRQQRDEPKRTKEYLSIDGVLQETPWMIGYAQRQRQQRINFFYTIKKSTRNGKMIKRHLIAWQTGWVSRLKPSIPTTTRQAPMVSWSLAKT